MAVTGHITVGAAALALASRVGGDGGRDRPAWTAAEVSLSMKTGAAFLRACGMGRMLGFSMLVAISFAAQTVAQASSMPMVSINDYHMMRNDAAVGDRRGATSMFYYVFGLRLSLMALDDAYATEGARRRICISPTAETGDLIDAIDEELVRNAAYWNGRPGESVVPLAIQAFARKWPCG